ncbi:MAG: ABC transporter ATP-binding protein [Proteobacteria bacterium]|nr:ABC transporter ATP-binding protein [Pseudomonadota bacterium]
MPDIVLALEGVSAGYGDVAVVHDFSAALARGSITTLIGGNGAGKSTLMRAIYGTCRCFAGHIRFDGTAIEAEPPWQRLARGVGLVPQGRCNFPRMSVLENLLMGCYTLPAARRAPAIDRVVGLFPLLAPRLKTTAGNLSGGEQQVLEMAMVLVTEPSLLLLDEPSLGLSPKTQAELFEVVRAIARTGVTILVVEQNVRGALLISDTAIVLDLGRKFLEGPARDVMVDPRIRQAYLGGTIGQQPAA